MPVSVLSRTARIICECDAEYQFAKVNATSPLRLNDLLNRARAGYTGNLTGGTLTGQ